MSQDKINWDSDDLQRTMELPAVGGKSEPAGKVFDPWHLDGDGPPENIIDSIAKSLEKAEKMPETLTVSLWPEKEEPAEKNPSEETAEEIAPEPVLQDKDPEKDIDATQVVQTIEAEEEKEEVPTDATMVVPVIKTDDLSETEEQQEIIREKAKTGRIWPPVLISSLLLIVACFITLVAAIMPVLTEHGFTRGMTQIMAPVINAGEPPAFTNVLLVGVDEDGYRTDTMMVATYDVETDKVSVMQLPRDTYVANNGRTDKKLNSAFYSGIDQLKREIRLAYGIETHKYVEINLEAFRKMIDAIGGVETVVPFNMIYDDPTQDFHIYLIAKKDSQGNPLPQLLNGKKAEQFVRFRKNNDGSGYPLGDLQRMQAQRQFLMDAVKQMVSIDGLKNIDELIKIAQENVETDLTFNEIYDYCTAILTAEEGAIEFVDAPGDAMTLPFGSYFIVDYNGAKKIAQERFYATQATIAKMQRVVIQPVAPQPEEEPEEDEEETGETSPPGAVSRPPAATTSPSGSSAATRPDEDDPPETNNDGDSGSGAMSR